MDLANDFLDFLLAAGYQVNNKQLSNHFWPHTELVQRIEKENT
jgi:hypothetical protein